MSLMIMSIVLMCKDCDQNAIPSGHQPVKRPLLKEKIGGNSESSIAWSTADLQRSGMQTWTV